MNSEIQTNRTSSSSSTKKNKIKLYSLYNNLEQRTKHIKEKQKGGSKPALTEAEKKDISDPILVNKIEKDPITVLSWRISRQRIDIERMKKDMGKIVVTTAQFNEQYSTIDDFAVLSDTIGSLKEQIESLQEKIDNFIKLQNDEMEEKRLKREKKRNRLVDDKWVNTDELVNQVKVQKDVNTKTELPQEQKQPEPSQPNLLDEIQPETGTVNENYELPIH